MLFGSLSGSSIGSLTISDHAPISYSLAPLSPEVRHCTWQLNENLLDDAVAQKQISDTISLYFKENMTRDRGGICMGRT